MPDASKTPARALAWTGGITLMILLAIMPWIGGWIIGGAESDWMAFLGRFHIVCLHVPIGLFVWVAVLETGRIVSRGRWNADPRPALAFGAFSAAVTALLGYLLLREAGSSSLLVRHMWTGIAFSGLAILTFLLRWSSRNFAYAVAFVLSLGAMIVSAHLGASSVHGSRYLSEYAPSWLPGSGKARTKKVTAPRGGSTVFATAIEPILQAKCAACHNPNKAKGKLDVATFESLMKGGGDGPVIVAGEPQASPLIGRMELPLDDDDHMPPDGEPQPSPEEIALIKWWISRGASATEPASDIPDQFGKVLEGLSEQAASSGTND